MENDTAKDDKWPVEGADYPAPPPPPDDDDPYWDRLKEFFYSDEILEPRRVACKFHFMGCHTKIHEDHFPVLCVIAHSDVGSNLAPECLETDLFEDLIPEFVNRVAKRFENDEIREKVGPFDKIRWATLLEEEDEHRGIRWGWSKLELAFDKNGTCTGYKLVRFPENPQPPDTDHLMLEKIKWRISVRDQTDPPNIREYFFPGTVMEWTYPYDPRDPKNAGRSIKDELERCTRISFYKSRKKLRPEKEWIDFTHEDPEVCRALQLERLTKFADELTDLCKKYEVAIRAPKGFFTGHYYKLRYKPELLLEGTVDFDTIQYHDEHDLDSPEYDLPTEWWDFQEYNGKKYFLRKRTVEYDKFGKIIRETISKE
jgi:hypothetical protein